MDLDHYVNLIQAYLDRVITASDFEVRYNDLYSREGYHIEKEVFRILDDLFLDIEAYDPRVLPNQETMTLISEETLRIRSQKTLSALQNYIARQSGR